MRRLLTGRTAAVLMTAAALIASGGIAASAQAAAPTGTMSARSVIAPESVQPDFTCPGKTVCLFPNDDYTGNYPAWGGPATLATDVWNGRWYHFSDAGASNPNPGSLHDNSGSIIWIYAKDLNRPVCLTPGKYDLNHVYGYFFIRFGVQFCTVKAPTPLP